MQKGKDIAVKFKGLFLVHHNMPGSEVASHAHAEHHIIMPLKGEVSVALEHSTLTCGPGRMIYVRPDTTHTFRSAREKGERLICMLDDKAWAKAGAGDFQSVISPASQLCKEILFYLLLNQTTQNAGALIDVFVRTLHDILEAAAPPLTTMIDHAEGRIDRPELRKAIALARAHYAEDFTIEDLAKGSGISVRNLSRLFQTELGLSPKQLLTSLRIEKAKELLLAGETTVTETAFQVGYHSLSQFIAAFRKLTGQIPSAYAP